MSSRKRLHKMLANRGLQVVPLHIDWGCEKRLQDVEHPRINLPLIPLGIQLVRPQRNRDNLVFLQIFRNEGQDFQETRLLPQDRNDFVLDRLHEFVLLLELELKIKDASDHGSAPFKWLVRSYEKAGGFG